MKTRLYAAYGSNLNREDWTNWCKKHDPFDSESIKPVGTAWLPDFELVFDYDSKTRGGGALNLRERMGGLVPVGLFSCTEKGHAALTKKEGAPSCYKEILTTALKNTGIAVEVFTFQAPNKAEFEKPSDEYLKVVREGYLEYGFDPAPLEAAVNDSPQELPLRNLFVYGTLMREQPRFGVLQGHGVSCALLAQCHGTLLNCGEYPGMIEGDNRVQGEFIRLERFEKALAALDEVEGFEGFGIRDSLFERRLVEVDLGDGHTRPAWTYCLREKGDYGVIPSGDWREHLGVKGTFLNDLTARHVDGREHEVAVKLTARTPFDVEDETGASRLKPLSQALSCGLFSERELAQVTNKWAVCS